MASHVFMYCIRNRSELYFLQNFPLLLDLRVIIFLFVCFQYSVYERGEMLWKKKFPPAEKERELMTFGFSDRIKIKNNGK